MIEVIELSNQEKNQNTQRKGNLQVLENIGSRDERKNLKSASQENKGTTQNQTISSKG